MAKNKLISKLTSIVIWITGILVSLAVGFGMIDGILTIRWMPPMVTIVAGWVVVVLAILGVILAIVEKI